MVAPERAYRTTHSWINFQIDLRDAPVDLWVLLGEAQSKIEHVEGAPLKPYLNEELHKVYLAKGIHATSAIEGNTLTEEQVKRRLEGKLELPRSQEYLGKEIDNLLAGYNMVMRDVLSGSLTALTPGRICEFNRVILDGLELEEGVVPGGFRRHNVGVARYAGAPWEDCEHLVQELCEWLASDAFAPPTSELSVGWILLKAIVAHLYFAWIHPFGDGNGRTARLIEYQIMVGGGLPTVVGHLLSSHYNQTRTNYYLQLDRTSRGREGPLPFIRYAMGGFVDQVRQVVDGIRHQQMMVAWQNYVHEELEGVSPPRVRQRHLLLDLAGQSDPVHPSRLTEISPRVIRAYADKTPKTLSRDINALRTRALIVYRQGGYVANTDLIRAFLPDKAPAHSKPQRRRSDHRP